MNLYSTSEACLKCGAAANKDCEPDCVLMQDPSGWCDDLAISDADPGL